MKIWCGACSTGQEPYSVALVLREHFAAYAGWKLSIVATDLSTVVLARAKQASYSQLEVNRGLPAPLLLKYFERRGMEWRLKDDVGRLVEFRKLNLLEPSYGLKDVDVVFLRNVLIYSTWPRRKQSCTRSANC